MFNHFQIAVGKVIGYRILHARVRRCKLPEDSAALPHIAAAAAVDCDQEE